MDDATLDAEWAELTFQIQEGNLTLADVAERWDQMRLNIVKRQTALIAEMGSRPDPMNRARIAEQLAQYRRMYDEMTEAGRRIEDRAREREVSRAQDAYARASIELAQASNDLSIAGHAQAKALTIWTRVLAFATIGLFLATVVLAFRG